MSCLVYTHNLDIGDFNKCRSGYAGKHCRARCIYPYYGEECESECNCSERMCDVATGCKAVDEGMAHFLTIREIQNVFHSTHLKSFKTNYNSEFVSSQKCSFVIVEKTNEFFGEYGI